MYVCLCNGITDTQIKHAVDNGAQSYRDVRKQLGVGAQCGQCACLAREITSQAIQDASGADGTQWYAAAV